jgi:hypothetical protein
METAERPLRESEGLGAEGAPGPGRRFLVQQHPGLSLAAAKRIRKERMGRPKGDEAMQVKILQRSVLVGHERLAVRAQEVLRHNDMGG